MTSAYIAPREIYIRELYDVLRTLEEGDMVELVITRLRKDWGCLSTSAYVPHTTIERHSFRVEKNTLRKEGVP